MVWAVCLLPVVACAAQTTFYVRNVKVTAPCVCVGDEVYVARDQLLRLFKDAVGEVSAAAAGQVAVDGKTTDMKAVVKDGQTMFPVLAMARHLGWLVLKQADLGIVDVASPTKTRLAKAQAAVLPKDPEEEAGAKHLTRQLIDIYGDLEEDPKLLERVRSIGLRLARASGRPQMEWQFMILKSDEMNAISVGGGRVFVTTGMLELCDQDELAGAMAHEIAHNCLRHSQRRSETVRQGRYYLQKVYEARRRQREILASGGSTSSMSYQAALAEENENMEKLEQYGGRIEKWRTGDQWDEEREADRMGMIYAHDAGFNPLGLMHCLQIMLARESKVTPPKSMQVEGTSDHPPLAERIELTKKVYDSYFRH